MDELWNELFAGMRKTAMHLVPLHFYVATDMAAGECHEAAPAIASCLPDSRIVTANRRRRNDPNAETIWHSWVERDGLVVDAPGKCIETVESLHKSFIITDPEVRTLQEYEQDKGGYCGFHNRGEFTPFYRPIEELDSVDLAETRLAYAAWLMWKIEDLKYTPNDRKDNLKRLLGDGMKPQFVKKLKNIVKRVDRSYLDELFVNRKTDFKHCYLFNGEKPDYKEDVVMYQLKG